MMGLGQIDNQEYSSLRQTLSQHIEDDKVKNLLSKMLVYKTFYENMSNDSIFVRTLSKLIEKKQKRDRLKYYQEVKDKSNENGDLIMKQKGSIQSTDGKIDLHSDNLMEWVENKINKEQIGVKQNISVYTIDYLTGNKSSSSLKKRLQSFHPTRDYTCLSKIKRKEESWKVKKRVEEIIQQSYKKLENQLINYLESEYSQIDKQIKQKLIQILSLNKDNKTD